MDSEYPYEIGEVLLEALDIKQVLGGRVILDDLSIRIPDVIRPDCTQGQIVAVLGPSGIGKTTLFRILAGHDKPVSGVVKAMFNGSELVNVTPGLIGVVGQHYPLLVRRTALGNMLVAGRNSNKTEAEARRLLERFGIGDEADKYPSQLSGGQRQRLAIAQQLMTGSRIVLMDEPFSGLDPLAKEAVCSLLTETANIHEHGTIIVISHDIESALRIADTVWLMGRYDAEGQPCEGARIVEEINLMDSIAWRPDNINMSEFLEISRDIQSRYTRLKGL